MKRRVVVLGFFDGVHRGHQALLNRAVKRGQELNEPAAALLFDVPPRQILSGEAVMLLNTPRERQLLLHSFGMNETIEIPLTREFLQLDWQRYVSDFLLAELGAVHIVAGYDHRFGANGAGTAQKLEILCKQLGIGCDIIPAVLVNGAPVSSTRIRNCMEQGEFAQAVELLGHPHLLSGTVLPGRSVGRTLGFPTVNLYPSAHAVLPRFGVYAAKLCVGDQLYTAVVNIGVRPTFDDSNQVSVESFLLDFDGDLYEQEIALQLFHFIRPERKFDSPQALAEEIGRNMQQTRTYFAQENEAGESPFASLTLQV